MLGKKAQLSMLANWSVEMDLERESESERERKKKQICRYEMKEKQTTATHDKSSWTI